MAGGEAAAGKTLKRRTLAQHVCRAAPHPPNLREIEVCSAYVRTSYVKYRPIMYSVHTKFKLSILTHWSTQYFFEIGLTDMLL